MLSVQFVAEKSLENHNYMIFFFQYFAYTTQYPIPTTCFISAHYFTVMIFCCLFKKLKLTAHIGQVVW